MKNILSEKSFLKDVSDHHMKIIRNDGINRHIRFANPKTRNMFFDLVTWPGHLCYTGDMGTYVFSRLTDMFVFFRADQPQSDRGQRLFINCDYWAEKCVSSDKTDGIQKYSEDVCRSEIKKWRNGVLFEHITNNRKECRKFARPFIRSVSEELLGFVVNQVEAILRQAVSDYKYYDSPSGRTYSIDAFWEYDLHEYTHRFVWCCYALAWGIIYYDKYMSHGAQYADSTRK